MDKVLPLYPHAIVVIGIMSDDIDRAHLRMREANKPRWQVVEGDLVPENLISESGKVRHDFLYRRGYSLLCAKEFAPDVEYKGD